MKTFDRQLAKKPLLISGLKVHLKRHKSTDDLTCPEDGCKQVFASFTKFNSHVKKKHASCGDLRSIASTTTPSNGQRCTEDESTDVLLKSDSTRKIFATSCTITKASEARSKIKNEFGGDYGSSQSQPSSVTGEDIKPTLFSENSSFSTSSSALNDVFVPQEHHQHIQEQQRHQSQQLQSSSQKNLENMSIPAFKQGDLPGEVDTSSFQPQYTEARFNYTSSADSNMTGTLSTSNPSDILSLLHQSFFTIDDSEASLKLLSFLATQGNLQIFDENNQDIPIHQSEFLDQNQHQHHHSQQQADSQQFDYQLTNNHAKNNPRPELPVFSNSIESLPLNNHGQQVEMSPYHNHNIAPSSSNFHSSTHSASNSLVGNQNHPLTPNPVQNQPPVVNLAEGNFNNYYLSQQQQQHQQHQQQIQLKTEVLDPTYQMQQLQSSLTGDEGFQNNNSSRIQQHQDFNNTQETINKHLMSVEQQHTSYLQNRIIGDRNNLSHPSMFGSSDNNNLHF